MLAGRELEHELSRSLCAAQSYPAALLTLVREVSRRLEAEEARVWLWDEEQQELCASAGRGSPERAPLAQRVLREQSGLLVEQAVFAPLRGRSGSFGVLEAAGRRFTSEDLALLEQAADLAAPTLLAWRAAASGEEGLLRAVTRLTHLFDVSQSFSSTIQIEELMPILTDRTANVMGVETCRLWLGERSGLVCRSVFGQPPAAEPSPAIAEVFRSGVRSLDEERLYVPLCSEEQTAGVLEVARKQDGSPFTGPDADLLEEIAGQAARSIRNAQRHEAEKKVKELQALLRTSREITASLDLDRVLYAIVNQAALLLPADRCALALQAEGRYRISAIAGETSVNWRDERMVRWNELVEWAGQAGTLLYVSERDGQFDTPRPETREKLAAHFQETGMRSFCSLPLEDEMGPVGVVTIESATPGFLTESDMDLLRIFAAQATVALRNAQLYREVPLIGLLEPLAARKRAFLALPKSKRLRAAGAAAAVVVSLALIPWSLRVEGNAYVLPARTAQVSAEVGGIVEEVLVREGDRVAAGAVVATLDAAEHLLKLSEARTHYGIVERELQRAQAAGDVARARMEGVNLEQARREIEFFQANVDRTRLRSPIAGVVVTPELETRRGRRLQQGEMFCETAVFHPAVVEVAVSENDIGLVRAGQPARLKANAYPAREFEGKVVRISPQAAVHQDERVFVVTAEIDNPAQALRAGMLGKAKVVTERGSIGYAMLRSPAQWVLRAVWRWLP